MREHSTLAPALFCHFLFWSHGDGSVGEAYKERGKRRKGLKKKDSKNIGQKQGAELAPCLLSLHLPTPEAITPNPTPLRLTQATATAGSQSSGSPWGQGLSQFLLL
jgi:hypothetical protein